jgi:hypothetical protein
MYGTVFTNSSAADTVNFTLPPPALGLMYSFAVTEDSQSLHFARNDSEDIYDPNGTTVHGLGASSIGRFITVQCLDGANWYTTSYVGTWSE